MTNTPPNPPDDSGSVPPPGESASGNPGGFAPPGSNAPGATPAGSGDTGSTPPHSGAGSTPPGGPFGTPPTGDANASGNAGGFPPPNTGFTAPPGNFGAQGAFSADERNWALGAHLAAILGSFIGGLTFIGPLIIFLVKGNDSQFIRHHSLEALNFNLTVLIAGIVSLILAFVGIGILMLIALAIAWLVFTIIAAIKASNGEWYRYPVTIRMVK